MIMYYQEKNLSDWKYVQSEDKDEDISHEIIKDKTSLDCVVSSYHSKY